MHKAKIIAYIDSQASGADTTKAVKFEKLTEVLQKSMEIASYQFCSYEKFANKQYKLLKEVEKEVAEKFAYFLYQQLKQKELKVNNLFLKQMSIVKRHVEGSGNSNAHAKPKKVSFVADLIEIVKEQGNTFTSEDFIRYIDKFIVSDNSVVCVETDDEYVKNLQAIKEDEEALHKVGNDLDDFLFSSASEDEGKKSKLNKFLKELRNSALENKNDPAAAAQPVVEEHN